jgi:hypothetical protein
MLGYLFGWALISVCFSCVLFVLVPRNQNAWFGPKYMAATATGISKKMDLDPRGQLRIDTTMVFRVQFTDPVSKEPIAFSNPPYVRGMALGDWSVENNVTIGPHLMIGWIGSVSRPCPKSSKNVGLGMKPSTR